MYCKYCGKEIDENAELCVHCGRRLRSSFTTALERSEITRLRLQKEPKSPGLAAFLGFCLSWLLIGPVGYLYLGQWNWFWITLAIEIVAYPLTFGLVYLLFPFIFAFHQYQMAKELNDKLEQKPSANAEPANSGGGGGHPET
ncbi:MAG: zinc-ribbon domain-containing protein [Candidatus Latescibacteria bacterium]|nr:zinc-ribbon domain-containing protein [Candidatus Latescibacterota bacterium]NIM22518.1 zinc-ribbon domain-containing protein [Candidatus Latescibacterota bacterium]NIM64832.1 zinc-ribbon domain-containing protein [Candidatus Latescibacterota bacterium]NIO01340.1 zinc-ribbon domain-containing protein [Candidatus Latescibacterota bacterium]NIO27829.1 zinc-ribbon domain-containing protein [Candidatus Latescibacterota bacterium]